MKKTLALVLAFVMALSCTAALAEEEEITIGILATLTGYPLNGEHMVKGTQLAADEINAQGGIQIEGGLRKAARAAAAGGSGAGRVVGQNAVAAVHKVHRHHFGGYCQ